MLLQFGLEIGPDPARAYIWPDLPLTQVLFDLTRSDFFYPKCKKYKNLTFLGEIFQTQTIDGWPNPSHKKFTWPILGQKFLTWTHH